MLTIIEQLAVTFVLTNLAIGLGLIAWDILTAPRIGRK